MGILKNIWITLFGKSKKQEEFSRGGSIEEPKMKIVHTGKIGGYTSGDVEADKSMSCAYQYTERMICRPNLPIDACKSQTFSPDICNPVIASNVNKLIIDIPNGDDFFVSKELLSKEKECDSKFADSAQSKKNKRVNNVIGQKTLADIKKYLITYGSIDVFTCEQKFNVKSLRNFIWHLRKEGLLIKTQKVGLHNEFGQKIEVTNYKLISVI